MTCPRCNNADAACDCHLRDIVLEGVALERTAATETCPAGTLAALEAARAEVERLNGVLEAAKHVKAAAESVFQAARDRRLAIPADWKSMKKLRNAVKQLNAELGKESKHERV